MASRIKNPTDADRIDPEFLAWQSYVMPITEHFCRQIAGRDYSGKKLACWQHLKPDVIPMLLALLSAGAEITVGACNVDSTDDATAAYLAEQGITVYGWQGMSRADYEDNLRQVRRAEADYLCDMGGELSVAYTDKQPPVKGALEATTSGLHLLRANRVPFPVFDWNSIPLKERIENRFHVGDSIWPTFSQVTTMSLFGRRVLVIGYGPVGKGVAERARKLGAIVHVADLDPVRQIEARFHGCEPVELAEGLAHCQVVVSATGIERVLREEHLRQARPGAIFLNAGHSKYEIDIDWLYSQPHQRMKAHIERFELAGTHLFLLGGGSPLNLAAGAGPLAVDVFDHYIAVMLLGIAWMFDGIPADIGPGLQPYPAHLEQEIARMSIILQNENFT